MKRILSLILLSWFCTLTAVGFAKPSPAKSNLSANLVSNLVIDTLAPRFQQLLRQKYPQYFQQAISLGEAEEMMKWLHLQADRDIVQLWQTDDNQYEFKIVKRLRIKEITFKGLSALTQSEATRILGIQINDAFENDSLVSGGERIRKTLQDLGYLNAQIDIEFPTRSDGHIALHVIVSENKQTQIKEIKFESVNEQLNKDLQKNVNSFFKEAFTQESMDRITKKAKEYLIEKRYSRAEIIGPQISFNAEETEANLKFKVDKIERYEFRFKGNFYKSAATLSEQLDLKNFYSANTNIGIELLQKLKNYYQSEGYARCEVQVEEKEDRSRFLKILTFSVHEGVKIKIDKIQILGRISKAEDFYRELLLANASSLLQDGYYSRTDVESAANNLKLELQNQGFLLAKIVTIRTPLGKDKDKVPVLITLDEGPQTLIDSIEFIGNQKFTLVELLRVSGLSPNGPLQLNKLDTALQNLSDFYRSKGYLEMTFLNQRSELVTYKNENTKASLKFKIFEGPQVRVASIVLEGNTFTQDRVILNEVNFSNNDVLTPQKIDDSILRLQRTGYFGSIDIHTLEDKTAVADRTVVIRITEKDPGLLEVGFGLTSERTLTLRGFTGIAYRNLLGTGRGVSLRLEGNYNVAEIKYPEYKATVGYLEPYLLETQNRGRVSVTRSRTITDSTARMASEAIQTSFSVERDFTPQITGIWDSYSLSSSRDYSIDDKVPEVLIDIGTTGFSLDIDRRNSPFNPTKGTLTKLSIEYGSPGLRSTPTIEFWRATSSFTHFKPLPLKSWNWSNHLRLGYLQNLSHDLLGGVPYDKKGFILGGRSTIRGFEAGTDEVFPNYKDLRVPLGQPFYLTGDAKMGLVKSEISFPLYGNFSGSLFYDGGAVVLSEIDFKDNYRDSVGIGLKYNTPVGPLNLDVGWKLDRKDGESINRFHLGFGTF